MSTDTAAQVRYRSTLASTGARAFGLQGLLLALAAFLLPAAALVGGRVVFLVVAASAGVASPTFSAYVKAAMLPGLPAALAQLAALPPLAAWWVRRERRA